MADVYGLVGRIGIEMLHCMVGLDGISIGCDDVMM